MRNLKRALSLTLASVMLLGMMVLGTSAASYPDVNDEHNVEAIEVLQAIGVMSGSNSGNFNPDGKVTRIEMAIVMANLLDLDVDYFQGQNTFSDVPAWASGYVNACAASGIVTGVGSGRFGTGNVTATQAALMMLKALGYFQYNSDFGDDWARATALQASRIRLFDSISVQDNTQLTRNQVAQLALNALQATMVDADDNTLNITTSTGDATTTVQGGKVNYIVRASTDRKVATAISATETGGSSSVTGLNGWTIELGEQLYNGNLVKRDTNAITDEFGRPATEWRLKGEKIGVYNDEPDVTYTKSVKVGVIYKDLGLNRTIPASRVTVYVDGVENSNQTAKAIKGGDDTNKYGDNGILTQVFYDQDADSVVITEINTYTGEIARSVAASGTKDAYVVITTEGNAGERPAGVSGNLNYETDASFDNDVRVLYTYSQSTEEVMSVKVAESVEGTVTRAENSNTNDNDRKALTIDDHRYTASANSAGERTSDVTVKNDYVVYLDAYGYIIYIEESEVAINNYALLINTASNSTFIGNRARLLFTDGTIKNVETEKNYNTGSDKINDYTIVTARVDADGVYTLKAVDSTKSFRNVALHTGATNGALAAADYADTFNMKSDKAGITVDSGAKSYSGAAATTVYNANSATAIVVADAGVDGSGSDFTAYTGIKNAPTITATSTTNQGVAAYWFCKSGKMITAMFVFPESALEIEDSSNKLLFISKKSVGNLIHDNVGDYFEYDAVIGTEIAENTKVDETVKVDGVAFANSAATKDTFGGLYKSYTVDKHGIITGVKTYATWNANSDAEGITTGTGIDKTSKDYTVILDTAGTPKTITVDDAAKIWYVDKDGNISESSYRGISVDDDDTFYAVVKDFLVKTLVIQQVDGSSSAGSVPVAITSDKNSVVVGDNVTLTAKATLGRYDDINGYKWYSSNTSGLTLAQVKRLTPIAGATGETYQPATSTAGTTYYYCIVETTNDRADGVAESYASYALVVKPDPATSKNMYVSYRTNGNQANTEVGHQSISVDLSAGAKLLNITDEAFKAPQYYKISSTQTGATFASGAILVESSTSSTIVIVVELDKANNVNKALTKEQVAAALKGTKFEGLEEYVNTPAVTSVDASGNVVLASTTITPVPRTDAGKEALEIFWWGRSSAADKPTFADFETGLNTIYMGGASGSRPQQGGKDTNMGIFAVEIEGNIKLIPMFSDSTKGNYTHITGYTLKLTNLTVTELEEVAATCTIIFVGMLVYLYAAKMSAVYSRESLFTFWVMSIIYEYVVHCIYKQLLRNYIKKRRSKAVMIILTMDRYAEECVRDFEHDRYRDFEVCGIVIVDRPRKGETVRGVPVVANADDFYEYVRTHVVDEVFINGNTRDSSEALANQLIEYGITVHFNLIPQTALMPNKVLEKCGNYMVLTTSMHIASPPEMFFKRVMDIAGSLVGLVFAAVAFVIFAPVIKIQSPGPVLFSQERVGKNGRIFRIYKFRSMYVDAEERKTELMDCNEMDGLMFKMTDDPRIFPAGHFIRKYSIDELPQFWNVLKGEMSLVGTRPPTIDEVEHYQLHHRGRLGIKPGLTGMWQVSGRNDITDFEEVVALDTRYISEWSLSLDIKILLRTIQVVLSGDGSK